MTLDTKQICRLCGKWGGLTFVFDEDDLWLKIFMCFGVKIQKDDQITQQICKSCYFFTNSVYEFRLSSIEHDTELRKAYMPDKPELLENVVEEKAVITEVITYPSEETSHISQESFLNTFNLENKCHHPSVVKLKRSFPFVNIPKEWCEFNIDPVVRLQNIENDVMFKKLKPSEDLGIWSVRNKLSTGKHQPDLVLTRVRSNNDTSSNSDNNEQSKPQNVKKISPRRRRRSQWQKGKINANKGVKKISPQKNHEDDYYGPNNPSESDTMSISSTVEQDRNVLKTLLHTDAQLNCSFNYIEPRGDDYSNLLVTVGEEVKTYFCQTCNKVFDTQFALTNHKKKSHKSSLQCAKCSQRFNIVESLVKHNLTCHPEPIVANTTNTQTTTKEIVEETNVVQKSSEINENLVNFAPKSVARKRTGALQPKSPEPSLVEVESAIQPEIHSETEYISDTYNNDNGYVISSDDDDDVQITDVIDNADASTSNAESNKANESVNSQNNENRSSLIRNSLGTSSQSVINDVLLIDDSDEERGKNSNNTVSLLKPMNKSSSATPAPISFERNNDNISQKIVVVPSSEDKEHMDAASNASVKAKITNELSYINYIFSKCNFADGCKKPDKKWFLKDIHKFTEKTILPIEVIRSDSDEVMVEYGPERAEKYKTKTAFWNIHKVIDINKPVTMLKEPPKKGDLNNKYLPCEPRTIVPKPTTMVNTHTSQTSVKTVVNIASTSNVQSTSKTARVEPTKSSTPVIVGPSSISSIKPTSTSVVSNIQAQTVTRAVTVPTPSPANSTRNITLVTHQNPVSGTAGSSSNTVPAIAASSSILLSNSATTRTPSAPYNKPQPNQINARPKPVNTYARSFKPISPKPILPVSPNASSTADKINKPPEQKQAESKQHGTYLVPNGYILMGLPPNKDNEMVVTQNEDVNRTIANQPIVLNGMPFSSLTNVRNPNSQMVIQPMGQQTNVNIQNCINICHQEVSSTNQHQYATITVPVLVPNEQNQMLQLPENMRASQQQIIQPALAQNQSSDSNDSNSRPSIRIKNLAELTGDKTNSDQRNELHNIYSTALSNYVQTNQIAVSQDEYIQIS